MTPHTSTPTPRGLRAAILSCAAAFLWVAASAQPPVPAKTAPAKSESHYSASTGAAAAKPAKPGGVPKVVFEKTQINLGTLPEGKKGEFSFPFKNEGTADLKILEVRKTCGCTRADATKTDIKPGGSASVDGEFDTNNRSGKQMKTIYVKTNDPKNPQVTLRFETTVQKQIDVNPPSIHFASLDLNQTGNQEIKVTNLTKTPMKIIAVDSTNEDKIKAKLVSPLAKGKEGESAPIMGESQPAIIDVTVEPSKKIGNISGVVTIHTDSPIKPSIQVYVGGRVSGDLEVYPVSLFFGLLKESQPTTRTATISSRSSTPFKITKVTTTGMPLKVTYEPLNNREGYRLKVAINGPLKKQRNTGVIHLETTHPKQKTVDINVTAFVRK